MQKEKHLKGKKILFTVNCKKYIAKTNKKGDATVKVRLSKKTYKSSIKFVGENTYRKKFKIFGKFFIAKKILEVIKKYLMFII